jgi:hypothetical protein
MRKPTPSPARQPLRPRNIRAAEESTRYVSDENGDGDIEPEEYMHGVEKEFKETDAPNGVEYSKMVEDLYQKVKKSAHLLNASQRRAVSAALLAAADQMEMFDEGQLEHAPDASPYAGRNPRITISFETFTPESVENGDAEERGWVDKDGVSMVPDEYDLDDGKTAVDLAIKFLKDEGSTEASSSSFHPGVWYVQTEGTRDRDYFEKGEETIQSYHLEGFTPEEERAIFEGMKRR